MLRYHRMLIPMITAIAIWILTACQVQPLIVSTEPLAEPSTALMNKEIVARLADEVFNQGNLDIIDEVVDPQVVLHHPLNGDMHGIDAVKQWGRGARELFPDFQLTFTVSATEDNVVLKQWTAVGTHAASGKQVTMAPGLSVYRLEDGKIVEITQTFNTLDFMQRLGAVPDPAQLERNKSVLGRAYDEVFNGQNLDLLVELVDVDAIDHSFPGLSGVAAFKEPIADMLTAFPDLHVTADLWMAEGDLVMAVPTFIGTHQGEFLGIAPTGKQVKWTQVDINRVKDGKVVEAWHIGAGPAILDALAGQSGPQRQPLVREDCTDSDEEKVAVMVAYITALNAGDLDAALALYTDDAVVTAAHVPIPTDSGQVNLPTDTFRGLDRIRQFIDGAMSVDVDIKLSEPTVEGDRVVTQGQVYTTYYEQALNYPQFEATLSMAIQDCRIVAYDFAIQEESITEFEKTLTAP